MKDILMSLTSRACLILHGAPRLTVATLHRVNLGARVQPHHVEQHFRFLARYFHVALPSQPDIEIGRRRAAMVTVDDGHTDAYRYIFPLAKALQVPIAVCTSTDFLLRRQWLWFDRIWWAADNAQEGSGACIEGVTLRPGDRGTFRDLVVRLKRCLPEHRDHAIDRMMSALHLAPPPHPPEEYRSLTPDELGEMLDSGLVDLVAHTVTHTIATVQPPEAFRREARQCKEELEDAFHRPVPAFCYPNGTPGDFDDTTRLILQDAGFRVAFTSIEGSNWVSGLDPLQLRRVHVRPRQVLFEKLCSGLGEMQDALRRRRRPPRPCEDTGRSDACQAAPPLPATGAPAGSLFATGPGTSRPPSGPAGSG